MMTNSKNLKDFHVGSPTPPLFEKTLFLGEKRNLQLAVKKVFDAMHYQGEQSLIDAVQMTILLEELTEENFRDVVKAAAAWLNENEDASFWTIANRDMYLLQAMQAVLRKQNGVAT